MHIHIYITECISAVLSLFLNNSFNCAMHYINTNIVFIFEIDWSWSIQSLKEMPVKELHKSRIHIFVSPGFNVLNWTLSKLGLIRALNLRSLRFNIRGGASLCPTGGMMSPTGGPIKFLHFMHTYNLHFMHNYNLCTFYEYLYLHR